MDFFVGLDIGTSSVKALALGPSGEALGVRKKPYPVQTDPSGRHEEDPETIVQATLSVLRTLLDDLAGPGSPGRHLASPDAPARRPVCIALSAAMHGLIALDEEGRPLTPLITWADTRAAAEAAAFKGTPAARDIYRLTGTPIHPMSPLIKLRWLRTARPDLFAKAATFVSIKEYLWFRLFGVFEVDRSIASATGLFDTQAGRWYPPALEAAGITPDRLSKPVPVTHQRSCTLPGLEVPFVIGAGDGCLANLGSGVIAPGEASVTIGTSGAVRVVTNRWQPDPEERLFQYWLSEGMFVRGGASNNGGNVLDWFAGIANWGGAATPGQAAPAATGPGQAARPETSALDQALDEAFALPKESEGLLFLPYLYGERAPIWDAAARGAFIGLRSYHKSPHLLRAVTEGIGYALYDTFRLLDAEAPIHTVYASGGFTQNEAWVQQLADTFGKTVRLTDEADASATGAVFLGMLATGALSKLSDVKRHILEGKTYAPRPERHAYHQRYYTLYRELYPALSKTFHQL
ncbi:gluconokinase [Dinghuibacter silviterrae]|nr:gluconokinase [Dinghuibacter silviterrae]